MDGDLVWQSVDSIDEVTIEVLWLSLDNQFLIVTCSCVGTHADDGAEPEDEMEEESEWLLHDLLGGIGGLLQ